MINDYLSPALHDRTRTCVCCRARSCPTIITCFTIDATSGHVVLMMSYGVVRVRGGQNLSRRQNLSTSHVQISVKQTGDGLTLHLCM